MTAPPSQPIRVVTILIDNPESFLMRYVDDIVGSVESRGFRVVFTTDATLMEPGDVLFVLGCNNILTQSQLGLHRHNLVIHPSKLPEGRGSAALVNKILEGENTIYLSLFEATEKVDAGDLYFQEPITFEGHELNAEIRERQARKTQELVLAFLDRYPNVTPVPQTGTSTFYKRRTPKDSELDADKSISEQFDLLRVVDNELYPAFFTYRGHKYILRIEKAKPSMEQ